MKGGIGTASVTLENGLVVSAGVEVLPEHKGDTPVSPRYDVVYIQDARGWYYRYSHLKTIDVQPGQPASFDRFGYAVGISGDTVVVGARDEESASTGVNGDQNSNAAENAGAV